MKHALSPARRTGINALVALVMLVSLALFPARSASAHSFHERSMFVAPFGVDSGACDNPRQPCRTIYYAVHQATGKGNDVRVAAGDYFFDVREIAVLRSEVITVRGGYSWLDGYTIQNPDLNPTYLSGVPARFRETLKARGFLRVEDRTGRDDTEELTPGAPVGDDFATEISSARVNCSGGVATVGSTNYPCQGIDFMSNIPLNQFVNGNGQASSSGSNLWGHVDLNTGREYAIMGVNTGTAVVDVTDAVNPVIVGTVTGMTSLWREVKVYQYYDVIANRYKAYAYISTESSNSLQIIDLNNLPNSVSLAGTYTGDFSTSHTVYVSGVDRFTNAAMPGATPALIMNGTNRNSGRFRNFDIVANPTNPALQPGQPTNQPGDRGYTHDGTSFRITDERTAQCAANHNPCDLYLDYNEDEVELWDITDRTAPVRLSVTPYAGSEYTHSGWWTEDMRYALVHDELDEQNNGHNTRVYVLDLNNLAAPQVVEVWTGPTRAIDHNGYTLGDKYYMSNYRRGLTILDVSNPTDVTQQTFFDTFPSSDSAAFNGAWGTYPYLPSGNILISDLERGLLVVREAANTTIEEVVTGLTAANDGPGAPNTPVLFTADLATGTDITYAWNFGDGSAVVTTTDTTISHSYASIGEYTAIVTATNRFNADSAGTSVTVETPEVISGLTLASDSPVSINESMAFTATVATGNGITYEWNFGDGSASVTSTSALISHAYAESGEYEVSVTATNSLGDDEASLTVTVNPEAISGLTLASDSPAGINEPLAFTATLATGTDVTYTWDFGDGSAVITSTEATVSHAYAESGEYEVSVTAANSVGDDEASLTVTVNPEAISGLTLTSDSPVLIGTSMIFTAALATGTDVTYAWNFGDGSAVVTTDEPTASHTYAAIGEYDVSVTASNSLGDATETLTVTVNPIGYRYFLPFISTLNAGGRSSR